MSFIKHFPVWNMARRASRRPNVHQKLICLAAPASIPRHHGYSQLTLGGSRGAQQTAYRRVAIPKEADPESRCLTGTVLTPDSTRVDQAEIISCLPKLMFPLHTYLHNLIFFITPDYVKWFAEEHDFLHHAVNHIFQDWSPSMHSLGQRGPLKNHRVKIYVRVAVVDRLPLPDGKSSGFPGISLAASAWSRHWPETGFPTEQTKSTSQSNVPLICMRLPVRHGGEVNISTILLQPANTLFVNGRPHTMFSETWLGMDIREAGTKFLRSTGREYFDRFTFNHLSNNSCLTVPLQRLTMPREIFTCMGNIISKLSGKEGSETTSASLELEGEVASFMKSRDATSGTLAVYALITPKLSAETDSPPNKILGYQNPSGSGTVSEMQQIQNSIRLAISKGAHLHKVTSGGGGWGKKQGLLSLEPGLDFGIAESEEISPSTFEASGESGPIRARSGVTEIAQPGDMIEFFGLFLSEKEEERLTYDERMTTAQMASDTKAWRSQDWAKSDSSRVVVGVTPRQDVNVASAPSALDNKPITIPHQFGMLSEHGMVLTQSRGELVATEFGLWSERQMKTTRIDVPHTSLRYSVTYQEASPIPPYTAWEGPDMVQGKVVQNMQNDMPAQTDATHDGVSDRPTFVRFQFTANASNEVSHDNKQKQGIKLGGPTPTQPAPATHPAAAATPHSIHNSSEQPSKNDSPTPSRRARQTLPIRRTRSGVRIIKYPRPKFNRKDGHVKS